METAMSVYVETVRSWLGQIPEPGARSSDSLAYRTNRKAIWAGNIPEKYERLVDLVPGQRILELRAAEGVLSASAEVRRHAARGSLHLLSARRSCRFVRRRRAACSERGAMRKQEPRQEICRGAGQS